MAEKGIIIDVGFAPQWKDFLDEIDKELSKLDLDKYLNLDEAFNKQAKNVRKKLKELKVEIDQVINGVGLDPIKAFNDLNKSMKSLQGVVLNMAKAMPDGDKYAQEINSITDSVYELGDQTQKAVNIVSELNKVSANKLQFKDQLDQIDKLFGKLNAVYNFINNKTDQGRNKTNGHPFTLDDQDELFSEMSVNYQEYVNISDQIFDVTKKLESATEEESKEIVKHLDELYVKYGDIIQKIIQDYNNIVRLHIPLDIDIGGTTPNDIISDIEEQIRPINDYINAAKIRLQKEFEELGGTYNLQEQHSRRTSKQSKINIPVALDKKSEQILLQDVKNLIKSIQEKITEPILVEVQLVSAYQSRGNQVLLSQIQEEINNIQDGEITEKLRGLIDKMNKRVENAMIFNIHINTQNATNQIRHFTKEIKEEVKDLQKILTVNPEFEITSETREKLIKEIEKIQKENPFKIKLEFEDDIKNLLNVNIVKALSKLYDYIGNIESAVNSKTNAFRYEGELVQFVVEKEIRSLSHLFTNLKKLKNTINDVSQNLKNLNSSDQTFISNKEQSLYHYSNTAFTKFDKNKANKFKDNAFGKALYLTDNPANYEDFGKYLSEWVFNPDNVKILDQSVGFTENEIEEILNEYYSWCNSKLRELYKKKYQSLPKTEINNFNKEFGIDLEKILKHLGYDGIYDDINEQYAIFSPEKFKVKQITDTDNNQIVYLNKENKSIQDINNSLSEFNNTKQNNVKYNEALASSAYESAKALKEEKKSIDSLNNNNKTNPKGVNFKNNENRSTNLSTETPIQDTILQDQEINNYNKSILDLIDSLEKLIATGDESDKIIALLKSLHTTLNDFSNNKSADKLQKFTENLKELQKALKPLTNVKDNTFLSSIQDILSKGEELKTFAEILKSTKKELKNAKDALNSQDKSDIGSLNLENYSDEIKQRALNNIPDLNYQLMSQSLEATEEGLVKVTTLIKTANGEYVKYIHTSTDGEEIRQEKIESGTASILKQAQAIEKINAKAKDSQVLKKIGEINIEPNTPEWAQLVNLIKSFGIELSDVTRIIQTIDELGYESFQVFHGNGLRTTLGMNSETILYEKNNLVDLTETTKEFESILKKLPSETKKAFKDDGLATGSFVDDLEHILELYQKLINLSNSGMNVDLGKYQGQFEELSNTVNNIFKFNEKQFTDEFAKQFIGARDQFNNIFDQALKGTADMDSLKEAIREVEKAFEGLKDKSNLLADPKAIANQLKTVRTELYKNGAMDKGYQVLLEQYRDELEEALKLYSEGREKEANLTKQRLAEIVRGVMDVQGKIQESGKTGLTILNKIGQAIKTNFVQYVARYLSIQDIIRYIRSMFEEVKNLDTALTELRKVSDETTERLQVSFSKSAETAKELGNTLSYVINITADWSRLGFAIDEAEELARVTTLFKNVGDNMSADDASSYMISTLQGFQITAENSEEIVDKFNEVANNYAIDTRGIGEALQRSAASFNAANTSLSGAIAVVTTANEVVQNPEMVGTAMKTLSARIRGSKVELEELGDEEANVVDLTSKLRSEVKAMTGFDIMLDENTYKSIDEIIIGIGEHWDELTDIQQAALAEDLAGKRNSNVMIALLQNAEKVKDVYKTAEESAGSAQREQENYAKSIMYSIDRVKATWSEMIANILKSQDVKNLIDASADALTKLGDTAEKLSGPLTNIMKLLGMIANALATIISIGDGIPAIIGVGGFGAKKFYDKFIGSSKTSGRNKKPFLIIAGRYNRFSWDASLLIV